MRLLAATGIRLVGALPLHDVLSAARIKDPEALNVSARGVRRNCQY
jgi:hypothetical protein